MKSVVRGKQAGAHRLAHLTRCCESFVALGRTCCHRRPSPNDVSIFSFGLQGFRETCVLSRLNVLTFPHDDATGDPLSLTEPRWDLDRSS